MCLDYSAGVVNSIPSLWTDCGRYLKDPGSKLMGAAVTVLCAVASGSPAACAYTISTVLPLLLEQHSQLSQVRTLHYTVYF